MHTRHLLVVAAFSAACLPRAMAVDTTPMVTTPPPSPYSSPAPSDPLRAAREAIAAQQWPVALSRLQALQPQMPRNADLHNLLGYVHRKQARPNLDKALEHYRLALEIDPGHRGAHEYIGEAYLMRRQPAQAREHLETLRRLCGGTTCEEYQDLARAIAAYKD